MQFKRRKARGVGERLRQLLWPKRSWTRSVRYIFLRLKRLPTSPHKIALGVATGVFAVFTPFLGAQMVLAGVLAWVMRGSILASALASFLGNPLTYPVIWFSTYNLGNVLLGATASFRLVDLHARLSNLWDGLVSGSPGAALGAADSVWLIVKPMILGSLPLGIFAAGLAYVGVWRLIAAAHARRRERTGLHTAHLIGS
jgi:uncharacterized protein (DUF2062 family)